MLGENDEVAKWLKSIPPDQRKDKINTVISPHLPSTALHVAARANQPETAKILLNEGAGIILYMILIIVIRIGEYRSQHCNKELFQCAAPCLWTSLR
jgi:hypothetical protein